MYPRNALRTLAGTAAKRTAEARIGGREPDVEAIELKARHDERERLAREIHDGLGSELTVLRLAIARIATVIPAPMSSACHAALTAADTALDVAFAVTRSLIDDRTLPVEAQTLDKGLAEWVRSFGGSNGWDMNCRIALDARFGVVNREQGLALFRITQEALHNVAQHAQARRVIVRLHAAPDGIHLLVQDDGTGSHLRRLTKPGRFGLPGMQRRCELLDGTFVAENRTEGGFEIRIVLPWRTQEAPSPSSSGTIDTKKRRRMRAAASSAGVSSFKKSRRNRTS